MSGERTSFFDRLLGGIFLAAAAFIAAGRVAIARPVLLIVVRLVERLTDPLLAKLLWRRKAEPRPS